MYAANSPVMQTTYPVTQAIDQIRFHSLDIGGGSESVKLLDTFSSIMATRVVASPHRRRHDMISRYF
jgi:hypothetical protein